MGFGGISPLSLLLILAIIILLFGTKKLRNIGGDIGSAIKNFKIQWLVENRERKSHRRRPKSWMTRVVVSSMQR